MRWLVIHPGPSFSVADVHAGITEALRAAGEQVLVYNLDDRLMFFQQAFFDAGTDNEQGLPQFRRACTREQALSMAVEPIGDLAYKWWPDVVLGISAFFTPPPLLDMFRARGHQVVLWHTECPYQDDEQLERAAHADLNIVNDPATLSRYQALGSAAYIPHSYRPAIHHPGPARAELECDLAFVGTGFPSRREFFEAMDLRGLDVLLAGGWPGLPHTSPLFPYLADPAMAIGEDVSEMVCLDNTETAEIYRSARAGINFYRREGETGMAAGVAMGPREVEQAACGLFFLRDPRPEGDELLPMLPAFAGPEDASEQLRWWIGHDSAREKAAAAAREAVAGRTFESAARQLIRLAGEKRRTP